MDFELTTEMWMWIRFICEALMLFVIVYLGFKMETLTSHTKKLLDIMEKRERENMNNKNDKQ